MGIWSKIRNVIRQYAPIAKTVTPDKIDKIIEKVELGNELADAVIPKKKPKAEQK